MGEPVRDLRADRLSLGDAAVLSVEEAARLLPWRDRDARQWLHDEGLVIRRPGLPGPVVRWRDVLAALPLEPVVEPLQRPAGPALPRKRLKR